MLKLTHYLALFTVCALVHPTSLSANVTTQQQSNLPGAAKSTPPLLADPLGAGDDLLGDVEDDLGIVLQNDTPSIAPHAVQAPSSQSPSSLLHSALNFGKTAGHALRNTATNVQAALTTPNSQTVGTAVTQGLHDAVNVGKEALPVVQGAIHSGLGLVNKVTSLLPKKTPPATTTPGALPTTPAAQHSGTAPLAQHPGSAAHAPSGDPEIDALLK